MKIKINFIANLENTKSHFEIDFFKFHYERNGNFVLKSKKIEEKKDEGNKINGFFNIKSYNIKERFKKFQFYLLKKVRYEEVSIYEKIGVLTPELTSLALPILSAISTIPLNYFNINFNNFKYKIVPEYNDLVLIVQIKAHAYFRVIDLFK